METRTEIESKGVAIQIPFEWNEFYNHSAYFITYYGDVYFGFIAECPGYDDRFYIIQNDKSSTWRGLKPEHRVPEVYRSLGWEIRDPDIIKQKPIKGDANSKLGGYNEYASHSRNGDGYDRMFIFGAGASAFCTFDDKKTVLHSSKLRPPIGFEIFDEDYQPFCDKYPGVKLTIPAYEAIGRDIEECMEYEWQNFKNSYNPGLLKRHINVQYYLHKLFTAISDDVVKNHSRKNLYSLFANKLQQHYFLPQNKKKKFSIISFNYDTILDHYLEQMFETKFQTMNDYFNYNSNFLYFKPHGSCNWGWKFRDDRINKLPRNTGVAGALYSGNIENWQIYYHYLGDISENLAENSWGYELELNPNRLGKFTLNKNRIEVMNDGKYYPALLLPYRDKDEFVMHYDHQSAMKTALGEAEEVYLIGWKGNEDVFNRQWALHKNKLKKIVIADPQAEIVKQNLSKHFDLSKFEIELVNDFETFVLKYLDNYLG